ncbi:hypothetical protein H0X48_00795 [Candidatus Dependentiae bacterium]|nr:hypothetical protein [Candidatus Dependentiae bacterium]
MDTLSRYALGTVLLVVSLATLGQLARTQWGLDITYQLVIAFIIIAALVVFTKALKLLLS